jgi:GNAT superfamily N-acetyltransferase
LQLELTDRSSEDLRSEILAPLRAYNEAKAGPSGHRPLAILMRDEAGAIVGGLWGQTGYGWLFTQLLAVPDNLRGGGWGNRIMDMAEAEARARGCHSAWLDTFEFQARGFYEKRGYACFGELADYPPGFRRFFLQKRLEA